MVGVAEWLRGKIKKMNIIKNQKSQNAKMPKCRVRLKKIKYIE